MPGLYLPTMQGMAPNGFNPTANPYAAAQQQPYNGLAPQSGNSMAAAVPSQLSGMVPNAPAASAASGAFNTAPPAGIAAQLQQPQAPPQAPQAPAAPQGPPAAPAAPTQGPTPQAPQGAQPPAQASQSPFMQYAVPIAKYESGGGAETGNGGGAFQLEPSTRQSFEKANPAFAGQDIHSPAYQQAAYSWLTSANAGTLQASGVDATQPGVNYAAFALGAPAALAMAKASDPTANAADFVRKLPDGPTLIKGNPALFADNATIDDVFQRAQSIQTTGSITNAAQTASNAPAAPGAPAAGGSNTPDASSDVAALLAKLPNAPTLTPARSNPWLAFGAGMLGGHSLGSDLSAGLTGLNNANTGNAQTANDTALAQQNSALQTGQAKIELGKLAAFAPVLGATSVVNGQNVMMWRNGLGEVQYKTMDGQLVKQSMQDNTISAATARAQARLGNQDALHNAGTSASGAPNQVQAPVIGGPQAGGTVPGTNIPAPGVAANTVPGTTIPAPGASTVPGTNIPAPGSKPAAGISAPAIPTPANDTDAQTAAAPYLAALDAQAKNFVGPTGTTDARTKNNTAYTDVLKDAQTATDGNVAATLAQAAINANPQSFPQSTAWSAFQNSVTAKLGMNPFAGSDPNGNLVLSQSYLKQYGAAAVGHLLHDVMDIPRPTQQEVQQMNQAVATGSMPLSALNSLLSSGINANNGAIAEGRVATQLWANGKYAAIPGSFEGAFTSAQSNIQRGQYPGLFKPVATLAPSSNAAPPPGQAPGVPAPAQAGASAPVTLQATDTKGYDALPSGAQYIVNGTIFTKQ